MDVTEQTPAAPAAAPTQMGETKHVGVEFTGQAGQFFGIWIVNILLSIVTLGIYSAWAKVRTLQYFYGNTSIDGHRLAYLATPMQILKGRLLAIGFFILYTVSVSFFPLIGLAFVFILIFLMPWLINQGLRFSLRMTSYRNVRFSFHGSYGEAFMCFIGLPIVGAITLYLAMPWVMKKMDEYIHSNIRYGDKPLKVDLKAGEYYVTVLLVLLVAFIGFGLLAVIMGGAAATGLFPAGEMNDPTAMLNGATALVLVVYIVLIGLLSAIYGARIRNHIMNNSEFEGLTKFKSTVKVVPFAMLILVNTLAIVFTLGLAFPWAKIRQARFMAAATALEMNPNAEAVLDTMEEQKASFAEEAGEIFDVDVSIG